MTYNIPFIHAKLAMALTEQDRREKRGKRYNPYALAIYFRSLEDWQNDPRTETDPFGSLADYFTTCYDHGKEFSLRSLDAMVKSLKTDARITK